MAPRPTPQPVLLGPYEDRTIRLPIAVVIEILRLVQAGEYGSFEEAVTAALRQFVDRSSGTPPPALIAMRDARNGGAPSARAQSADISQLDFSNALVPDSSLTVTPNAPENLVSEILPFTIPRLFPMKLALRSLAAEVRGRGTQWVEFNELAGRMGAVILSFRERMERLDLHSDRDRGERLSTAFPTARRDADKSLKRFFDMYLGLAYKENPRVTGAPILLGLAALQGERDDLRIGITAKGLDFVKMGNPILDGGGNKFPPWSAAEAEFLLDQIRQSRPKEVDHVAFYLRGLKEISDADRAAMNRYMRRFYERIWSVDVLTDELIDSTRQGLHSRCRELGLTDSIRKGQNVSYALSQAGVHWLTESVAPPKGRNNQ